MDINRIINNVNPENEAQCAINRVKNQKAIFTHEQCKDRLTPYVWPAINPKFQFKVSNKIFTIGSCFARNIERQLADIGCNVPTLNFSVPKDEYPYGANGILNKYTPAQIYQEVKWAHGLLKSNNDHVSIDDIEQMLFRLKDGNVIDTQLSSLQPVCVKRALQRRQEVFDLYKQIFESDVVIITLGLIESWFDSLNKIFLHEAPVHREMRRSKGRYYYHRLTYLDCIEYIQETISLINSIGCAKKILLTTSPVPLARTFEVDDIIIANCYSKSMLRTVCGELSLSDKNIDYYPSYENVSLTKTWDIYEPDMRHVSESFVRKIVINVCRNYIESFKDDSDHYLTSNSLMLDGKYQEALREIDKAISINKFEYKYYLLKAETLRRTSRLDSAIEACEKAKELGESFDIDECIAQCFADNKKYSEALAEIDSSIICGNRSAKILRLKGLILEAENSLEKALEAYKGAALAAPKNFDIKLRIANLLHDLNQMPQGRLFLEEVDDEKINDIRTIKLLGKVKKKYCIK